MDESIPSSVGEALERRGHTVYRAKEYLGEGEEDAIVTITADQLGAILIVNDAHHRGGFSPTVQGLISHGKFRRLHRIVMRCAEVHMARRVQELLPDIEYEYGRFQQRSDKRMYLEIGTSFWRSNR